MSPEMPAKLVERPRLTVRVPLQFWPFWAG